MCWVSSGVGRGIALPAKRRSLLLCPTPTPLHNTHMHIATVVVNSILAAHFKFVLENSNYFIAGGRLKKKCQICYFRR